MALPTIYDVATAVRTIITAETGELRERAEKAEARIAELQTENTRLLGVEREFHGDWMQKIAKGLEEMEQRVIDSQSKRIAELEGAAHKSLLGHTKLSALRTAVADYMHSEGCSCCQGDDHDMHTEVLAKLLGVELYSDGSGYCFSPYKTGAKKEED